MSTAATTTRWSLDPAHSELTFKVKHLMITNVKGEFRKFNATVESQDDRFEDARVLATAEAGSIDTNNADRDKHLKSGDFFDAGTHQQIRFEGTTEKKADGHYALKGELTMKGISKPVTFDVEFGGLMKDPYGNQKAGFSFGGTINRKDWGLNWNAALETGGVLVSDEVKIDGEVQFIKEK